MTTLSPPKKRPQFLDINVLPQEYRQPALSRRSILFLLVILVAGFSIYSLYPLQVKTRAETTRLRDSVDGMRQEMKAIQTQDAQVKEQREAVSKLEVRKKELLAGWQLSQKNKARWPLILDGIQGSLPAGVNINALSQKEAELSVQGLAPSLAAILEYASNIRRLGLASDLGMTYQTNPQGVLSFDLHLIVKLGSVP